MIGVIDYGVGNLGSIINMIKRVGGKSKLIDNNDDLDLVNKIIIPGVGSFDHGMKELTKSGLIAKLNHKALEEKIPTLGICLGAQIMCKSSEEGNEPGLGWFDAEVVRFPDNEFKVPHMGWNIIHNKKEAGIKLSFEEERFYFVHSYYMKANNPNDVWFTTNYGIDFTSALNHDNLFACQFHPEKSHKFGYDFFKSFIAL